MTIGVNRNLQLGADAVIGRNQNRIGEASRLEVEQTTKAANFTIGTGGDGLSELRA